MTDPLDCIEVPASPTPKRAERRRRRCRGGLRKSIFPGFPARCIEEPVEIHDFNGKSCGSIPRKFKLSLENPAEILWKHLPEIQAFSGKSCVKHSYALDRPLFSANSFCVRGFPGSSDMRFPDFLNLDKFRDIPSSSATLSTGNSLHCPDLRCTNTHSSHAPPAHGRQCSRYRIAWASTPHTIGGGLAVR